MYSNDDSWPKARAACEHIGIAVAESAGCTDLSAIYTKESSCVAGEADSLCIYKCVTGCAGQQTACTQT